MFKYLKAIGIGGIFLTVVLLGGPAAAQSDPVGPSSPDQSITSQEQSVITRTSLLALSHLSQARANLHQNRLELARHDLAESRRLTETIRNNLSAADARNLIRIARRHLEYEPPKAVLKELPVIKTVLVINAIYIPTDQALRHVARAEGYLTKEEKKAAAAELERADQTLITIAVEEPLFKAEKYMDLAQRQLADNELVAADTSLKKAELQARAIYTLQGAPLALATNNIWLAFRNYSSGRLSSAWNELEQARTHLDQAATTGLTADQNEAKKLSQALAALDVQLIKASDQPFQSTLKAWWERSRALTERVTANLSAGLDEEESTLSLTGKLISARLHLAYAYSYQVVAPDPRMAAAELNQAETYVQHARQDKLADDLTRATLGMVAKELTVLKTHQEQSSPDVRDRYEVIRFQLSTLIQEG